MILPASSGTPITPVEPIITWPLVQPSWAAVLAAQSSTAISPFLPVKALALPALTSSARADPQPCFSCLRHQSTGAEGALEVVNIPATDVPFSNVINNRSSRP